MKRLLGFGRVSAYHSWFMRALHTCTYEWLIEFQMMVLHAQRTNATTAAGYGPKTNS